MAPSIVVFALAVALSQSQPRYSEYGQHTERGGTRVAYWDNEKDQAVGEVAIEYGRPLWKAAYDEQLDAMTSGKIWRLGENFWTSLDSNLTLTIGGVEVPVGYYYLVVKRSEDGSKWSLAFVDPVEIRKKTVDPFEVTTRETDVPVRFEAPLTFEPQDVVRERLVIELTEERLVIQWGSFALSAPVSVSHR